MSDIRRLSLDMNNVSNVTAVPRERYVLGDERASAFEKALPEIEKLPYWGPEFQAWEPFVTAYLQSGVVPSLAAAWLPKFSSKIEELGPRKSKFHRIYSELQRMYKVSGTECFDGYKWEEIEEFVDWIPTYIDNRRVIYKFLFDETRYMDLLTSMLKLNGSDGYGNNLPYAVYLHRHCMLDFIEYPHDFTEGFQRQLDAYTEQFSKTFNVVAGFIGENSDVYRWYSPGVERVIVNAWKTSLDTTSKRVVITNRDVFNMEVWLSEQLTDYVTSLPCTYTVQPDGVFVLDALEYALSKDSSFDDPNMIYAFCIPKDYVKSFIDRLSEFFWDVKEGRFVAQLRAMVNAAYSKDTDGSAKSPEQYDDELRARGFPLD